MLKNFKNHFFLACVSIAIIFCQTIYASQNPPNLSYAIGQMMMIGFDGSDVNAQSSIVQEIKNYHIGGILLLDHAIKNNKKYQRNVENPQQVQQLINKLQMYARLYHDQPLLIATNQEGGLVNEFPKDKGFYFANNLSQQDLGKKNNLQQIYLQAYQQGKILRKLGVNVNFAPVADLNSNPKNPAIGMLQRSYSKDAEQVTADLRAAIAGYHKANIFCTLKHFPGLGSANENTDYAITDVTNTWSPKELQPYKDLINSGDSCDFIMVTHLINRRLDSSGTPASLSKKVVTNLLRQQLHYQGLIITDDMDAKAIRQAMPPTEVIKKAVLAGNDIILYGGTQGYNPAQDADMLYQTLLQAAQTDPIAQQKIYYDYHQITYFKRQKFIPKN